MTSVLSSLSNISVKLENNYSISVCNDTLEAVIPPLLKSTDDDMIIIVKSKDSASAQLISVNSLTKIEKKKLLTEAGGRIATKFDIAQNICQIMVNAVNHKNISGPRKMQVLTSMSKCLDYEDSKSSWILLAELILKSESSDNQIISDLLNLQSIDQQIYNLKCLLSAVKNNTFENLNFSKTVIYLLNNNLNVPEVVDYLRNSDDDGFISEFLSDLLEFLSFVKKENVRNRGQKKDEKKAAALVDLKLEKLVSKSLQLLIVVMPIHILCQSLKKLTTSTNIKNTLEKLVERLDALDPEHFSGEHDIYNLIEGFEEIVEILVDNCLESSMAQQKQQENEKQKSKSTNLNNQLCHLIIYVLKTSTKLVYNKKYNPDQNKLNLLLNKILPKMNEILNNPKINKHVRASCMLYISEMTEYLESSFLPFLDEFYRNCAGLLAKNIGNLDITNLCLKSMQNLIQFNGFFMSGNLSNMLEMVGNLDLEVDEKQSEKQNEEAKTLLQKRVDHLQDLIAEHVPLRIYFPALIKSIDKIENKASICSILNITSGYIKKQSPTLIKSHLDKIKNFSMKILKIRQDAADDEESAYSTDSAAFDQIEAAFSKLFLEFIKKLEESTFISTFYKIFIWATTDFTNKYWLAFSFYNISLTICENLKSIFVLNVGLQMTTNIKEILIFLSDFRRLNKASFKNDKFKSISVILNLVSSLCKFDKKEFVKNHLFESVSPVLVDFIQKTAENEEFIVGSLAPCIAKLCNAMSKSDNSIHSNILSDKTLMVGGGKESSTNDDSDKKLEKFTNVKALHYEILQKTRFKNSKIRLAALLVLEEMIKVLGIHYENLWPEAMPIFHELFEDDSEIVAEKTRSVCLMVKEIVGEEMEGF